MDPSHKAFQISSILIANRGEISSRIAKTCKRMGINSIAVYSEADRFSTFVKDADFAVYIGDSNPANSYLNQDKIIEAAKQAKADAIHPGYGFLSENFEFARRCHDEGIIFIGPHPDAIRKMGSKAEAKKIMESHGVPTLPGYQGTDQSLGKIITESNTIGYPLLLKATAGGGGRGMRIVHRESELKKSVEAASREAQNAFGNNQIIIEKYIENGRHIEFQIFGDKHGNIIHLYERECSIQRRYQKIIEESPSPIMKEDLRSNMSEAAVTAAKALNYDNAGTVEFIYDEDTNEFYFLEVNTRLQVEHPVTEEITGLDLVQMQIESAQGNELSIKQSNLTRKGYAIEARLYAEDPDNNFLPVTGKIERLHFPIEIEGLRVETAIESGSEISIFYDPMIAKIIMWSDTRTTAIRKLNFALREMICQGITSNLQFLIDLTSNEEFIKGKYNTHFVQKFQSSDQLTKTRTEINIPGIAASVSTWLERDQKRKLLRHIPSGWRNNYYTAQEDIYVYDDLEFKLSYRYNNRRFQFITEEKTHDVRILSNENQALKIEIDGIAQKFNIVSNGEVMYIHNSSFGNLVLKRKKRFPDNDQHSVRSGYQTPMPAQIVKILVSEGQEVRKGEDLIILSSMKMESTITSVDDGQIEEIFTVEGENVGAGFQLLKFKELE